MKRKCRHLHYGRGIKVDVMGVRRWLVICYRSGLWLPCRDYSVHLCMCPPTRVNSGLGSFNTRDDQIESCARKKGPKSMSTMPLNVLGDDT